MGMLSIEKIEEAKKFAKLRNDCARNNYHDGVPKEQGVEMNCIGILGEMALADYFEIPYIFTNNTYKGAPDILCEAIGYEVKTSRGWTYYIKLSEKTDIFVFVKLDSALYRYTILGQINRASLFEVCADAGSPDFWDDGEEKGWRINYRDLKKHLQFCEKTPQSG